MTDSSSHSAALDALRTGSDKGEIADITPIRPGIELHADPALGLSGTWRSPAGRLLEIEAAAAGTGDWAALHIRLGEEALEARDWVGFVCRTAAPAEVLVRPCLRSGTGDGFSDTFFPRHLLSVPEVLNHADALHLPTARAVPRAAPWRELVLFLPRESFVWHLHDLRLFAA